MDKAEGRAKARSARACKPVGSLAIVPGEVMEAGALSDCGMGCGLKWGRDNGKRETDSAGTQVMETGARARRTAVSYCMDLGDELDVKREKRGKLRMIPNSLTWVEM